MFITNCQYGVHIFLVIESRQDMLEGKSGRTIYTDVGSEKCLKCFCQNVSGEVAREV
jgi:hypothetical protein